MNPTDEHKDLEKDMEPSVVVNPVYDPRDRTLKAECIYFYYLTEDPDPRYNLRVFVIDRERYIPPQEMQREIETIVADIRNGNLTPCGWAFGDVKWRRKSYIVVVFDDPNGKLSRGNAVEFLHNVGGDDHPFRDGDDIQQFGTITGFYCFNHMKQQGTNHDLPPGKSECYKVTAIHEHRLGGAVTSIRGHNDTGTNMGPPIPPP